MKSCATKTVRGRAAPCPPAVAAREPNHPEQCRCHGAAQQGYTSGAAHDGAEWCTAARAASKGDDELLRGAAGVQAAHLRHVDGQAVALVLKGHLEAIHRAGLRWWRWVVGG